ncbi:FecR family protein [Uliginosibacterium sediminicola]|uniref:FecR domain-containing protein n=1 Tax=Uliginosibacterium sediminicola TaxID=2024550 RepID=A0ABU9YVR6_9RHOO
MNARAVEPDEDAIAAQAAEWIVMLSADDPAERAEAQVGFSTWKQADPRHAAAAAQLEGLIGQLQAMRQQAGGSAGPARAALHAAQGTKRSRSKLPRALGLLLLMLAPAYVTLQIRPPAYWLADFHTATGEWATHTLQDGTRVTLNSASAINLHYDAGQRRIELVQGEILVDVAKDRTRPFVVETPEGNIRALGTRFVVDREEDATLLSMLESKVLVRTAREIAAQPLGTDAKTNAEGLRVSAGERVRMTPEAISPVEKINPRELSDAWQKHELIVNNAPLSQVLDALARQRPGYIQYNRAQIENIRVSAVLPLNDSERALQLLLNNFPQLRIRMLTRYLVLIDAPTRQ